MNSPRINCITAIANRQINSPVNVDTRRALKYIPPKATFTWLKIVVCLVGTCIFQTLDWRIRLLALCSADFEFPAPKTFDKYM